MIYSAKVSEENQDSSDLELAICIIFLAALAIPLHIKRLKAQAVSFSVINVLGKLSLVCVQLLLQTLRRLTTAGAAGPLNTALSLFHNAKCLLRNNMHIMREASCM